MTTTPTQTPGWRDILENLPIDAPAKVLKAIDCALDECDRLSAALAEAEGALEPFAMAAHDADVRGGVDDGTCPDDVPIGDAADEVVTLGHCRRAASAIATLQRARETEG